MWNPPIANDASDPPFVKYTIGYTDLTAGWSGEKTIDVAPAQTYGGPATMLVTGNMMAMRVKAWNRNECGAWSSTKNLLVSGLPEKPDAPYAVNSTVSQITLGWSYAGKSNGGVTVSHFKVLVSDDEEQTYASAGVTASAAETTFSYTCVAGTTY